MTAVDERVTPAAVPPPRAPHRWWARLRNSWRQLTSMRTALVLLFLLAVAAIPGSVLPQRSVNPQDVDDYFAAHPDLAPVLSRLGAFDAFASPWFSAIYLLLFTSLIGCVVPRLAEHLRALRAVPPELPRRLDRLPQFAPGETRPGDPAATAAAIAATLRRRRFRTALREHADGTWAVSAEKGYLKETGNLLFHAALLAVLVGVAVGSFYGWHGNRLLVQGADRAFCNVSAQYDESSFGPRVDAGDLPGFCLELTDFAATFQPTGQPKSFRASTVVSWTDRDEAPRRTDFTVNDPLRLHGTNVHLLGHGYAPILRYTDRYGQAQTNVFPFLPTDGMLTSEGVATFPDANVDPKTDTRDADLQVGFEGVYLPTVDPAGGPASAFPAERAPALFLTAYRGNLGLDTGITRSVYSLDRGQIARGQLQRIGPDRPQTMRPGDTWTLDDDSKLEFLGTRPFITIAVRHDPAQPVVLAGAVLGLIGLSASLAGRRRRVFFRVAAAAGAPGGSVVSAGGLPRTDYPGFADEFTELVTATRGTAGKDHPERTA